MKLIAITGIDGAGKTTLAHALVERLRQQGQPAAYGYGRLVPRLSRLPMRVGRFVFLRHADRDAPYAELSAERKRLLAHPLLGRLYGAAVWVDTYAQMWVKLLPHLRREETLILDRYIQDTVINDLAIPLGKPRWWANAAIEGGLRWLPMPAYVLLVDVPEETALERKEDIPGMEYLAERRALYQDLLDFPNVWMVDGRQGREALVREVLEIILQRRPGRTITFQPPQR